MQFGSEKFSLKKGDVLSPDQMKATGIKLEDITCYSVVIDLNLVEIDQTAHQREIERFHLFRRHFLVKDMDRPFKDFYKFKSYEKGKVINTLISGTRDIIIVLKGRLLTWKPKKNENYQHDFIVLGQIETNAMCNEYALIDNTQY